MAHLNIDERPLLHRLLFWLAVVGSVYGVAESFTIFFVLWDYWRPVPPWAVLGNRFGVEGWVFAGVWILMNVLLVIGSWGLLQRRSWSRATLITYAFLCFGIVLAESTWALWPTTSGVPPTWPESMTVARLISSVASRFVREATFAAVLLCVLMQREVAQMWLGGGFAPVEPATPAASGSSTQDGH